MADENLEKSNPSYISQLIKSHLYLHKFTELNDFIAAFKVAEAPMINCIMILKETLAVKTKLPARLMFYIKTCELLKERTKEYENMLKEVE